MQYYRKLKQTEEYSETNNTRNKVLCIVANATQQGSATLDSIQTHLLGGRVQGLEHSADVASLHFK